MVGGPRCITTAQCCLFVIGSIVFPSCIDAFGVLSPQPPYATAQRQQQQQEELQQHQHQPELSSYSSLLIVTRGRPSRTGGSRSDTNNNRTRLNGSSSSRNNSMYTRRPGGERSKRQERVGQCVQSELAQILHSGNIKGYLAEYLDDDLRQRISIVRSDLSPDLRQARISISVRGSLDESRSVDRRRAYAWLVRNTKPIRHTLAQQLKHMKYCPELTFVEVDVSAAVDVMALIDQVSSAGGYQRSSLDDLYDPNRVPAGVVDGIDFDDGDLDDDEDWDDEGRRRRR